MIQLYRKNSIKFITSVTNLTKNLKYFQKFEVLQNHEGTFQYGAKCNDLMEIKYERE